MKAVLIQGVDRRRSGHDVFTRYSPDLTHDPIFCSACGSFLFDTPLKIIANDSKYWSVSEKLGFIYGDDSFDLTFLEEDWQVLGPILTGSFAMPVYFDDVPVSQRARTSTVHVGSRLVFASHPSLKYALVTGRCTLVNSINGSRPNYCESCGCCQLGDGTLLDALDAIIAEGGKLSLDRSSWDGTSIFHLYGCYYPCILLPAYELLIEKGFGNLETVPIEIELE